MQALVEQIINLFDSFINTPYGKEIIVLIISIMPLLEIRGGLFAAFFLGLPLWEGFLIGFIGNLIPVPLILWLITPLFNYLKKTKLFSKFVNKLEDRALKKKEKIEKAQFWGLLLFIGIPLPGTGIWTGDLIASLINMNKKKAILASALGIIMAGFIIMCLSYGLLGNI